MKVPHSFSSLIYNCTGKVTTAMTKLLRYPQCLVDDFTTKCKVIVTPFPSHGVKHPADAVLWICTESPRIINTYGYWKTMCILVFNFNSYFCSQTLLNNKCLKKNSECILGLHIRFCTPIMASLHAEVLSHKP